MAKGKKVKAATKKAANKQVKKSILKKKSIMKKVKVAKEQVAKKVPKKVIKKGTKTKSQAKKVPKKVLVKKSPKKDKKTAKMAKKAVVRKAPARELKKPVKIPKKALSKKAMSKKADKIQKTPAGAGKSYKKAVVVKKVDDEPVFNSPSKDSDEPESEAPLPEADESGTKPLPKKAGKPTTKQFPKNANAPLDDRVLAEAHGKLEMPSMQVICADPNMPKKEVLETPHSPNGYSMGKTYKLLPGSWHYTFNVVQTEWDSRFGMIGIHHGSYANLVPQMKANGSYDLENPQSETETTKCGVDKGQFGFFDANLYQNDAACQAHHYASWQDLRTQVNAPTDDPADSQVKTSRPGVLTASGFGDGIYDLKAFLDKNGKLKAAYVVFINEKQIELMKQIIELSD